VVRKAVEALCMALLPERSQGVAVYGIERSQALPQHHWAAGWSVSGMVGHGIWKGVSMPKRRGRSAPGVGLLGARWVAARCRHLAPARWVRAQQQQVQVCSIKH
jgi:hypothetical protein